MEINSDILKRILLFAAMLSAVVALPAPIGFILILAGIIAIQNFYEGLLLALVIDSLKFNGEILGIPFLFSIITAIIIILARRLTSSFR